MISDLVALTSDSERAHNVLGIDLGTTNSTATWVHWSGNPDHEPIETVVEIEQQTEKGPLRSRLVPSVVHVRADGEVWVGEGARLMIAKIGRRGVIPEQTLFSETKNDIGTARRYPRANVGFETPQDVAQHILRFIHEESKKLLPEVACFDRVVVTVPASFSLSQREQTMAAAKAAGIPLDPSDLLDEPVAGLIYGLTQTPDARDHVGAEPTRALVFDFGGGTCDVALVELRRDDDGLRAATAGVSRYTRLGGADIDRALVTNLLLPRLLEANSIHASELTWSQKASVLAPQLMPLAEELKLKLSTEVARRRSRGLDSASVTAMSSAQTTVLLRERTLVLLPEKTRITTEQFRDACSEFLEATTVIARHTEYYEAASPLIPVRQVLEAVEWSSEDVDLVFTAGGSSKLPGVRELLECEFTCPIYAATDPEDYDSQTEISRGAAIHALAMQLHDKAVVQPRVIDNLYLRTEGTEERLLLLGRGTELPHFGTPVTRLRVGQSREIRLELLRGDRALHTQLFSLPSHVQPNERLTLFFDMDAAQLLFLGVGFPSCTQACAAEHRISLNLQAAWSNVHSEKSPAALVLEIEQTLKGGGATAAESTQLRFDLIDHYRKLKFHDRAAEQAMRLSTGDAGTRNQARAVNLLGIIAHERGDLESAVKYYRQAAALGITQALANMSLAQQSLGKLTDALDSIDEALRQVDQPPYRLRRAQILDRLNRRAEAREHRRQVVDELGPLDSAAPADLQAAAAAARTLDDDEASSRIAAELAKRGQRPEVQRGSLPVLSE